MIQKDRKNRALLFLSYSLITLAVAAIQCYSLWLPVGEKVDESETVHYAIGFFGGDLDPHWYRYGSISMYLLSMWYIFLFFVQSSLNLVGNLKEYAVQLFTADVLFQYGRYLFAIFGVITAFVYYKILLKITGKQLFSIVFLVIAFTAKESIYFANYIRIDQLVALLVAWLLYAMTFMHGRKLIYSLAIITALLFCTKISTFFMLGIFPFCAILFLIQKKISLQDAGLATLVFFLVSFLAQPFHSPFWQLLDTYIGGSQVDPLLGQINYPQKISMIAIAIYEGISIKVNAYLLYFLPTIIFLQKKYFKISLIILLVLFLFVFPYYFGNGVISSYWMNAVYDIVRFYCFLLAINLYERCCQLVQAVQFKHFKRVNQILTVVLLCTMIFIIKTNIDDYSVQISTNSKPSNKALARHWIDENLVGQANVLIDGNFSYFLPKFYDANNLEESKIISRVFIYNRKHNKYLNTIFEDYINSVLPTKPDDSYVVKRLKPAIKTSELNELQKNTYFITSPAIYKQMIDKKIVSEGHRHRKIADMNPYYNRLLSGPLVKEFKTGRGSIIQVYRVNHDSLDNRWYSGLSFNHSMVSSMPSSRE